MTTYTNIDVPFENRHTCWFCGEPSDHEVKFPEKYSDIREVNHTPLILPSCYECQRMKFNQSFSSINSYRSAVKDQLMSTYQKELSIGANWTEKELKESDFSGSKLEGLKRSGWVVYQIAKERVNYKGWPLSIDCISLDIFDTGTSFEFDGTRYTSLDVAIAHLGRVLNIDVNLLNDLIDVLGKDRFSYALKICRLNPVVSAKERKNIVDDIYENEQESEILKFEGSIEHRTSIKSFSNENRYLSSLLTRIIKAGRKKIMTKEEVEMIVGFHPGISDEKSYTEWYERLKQESRTIVPNPLTYSKFNFSRNIKRQELNQIVDYAKWENNFSLSNVEKYVMKTNFKEFRSNFKLGKEIDSKVFISFIQAFKIRSLNEYYVAYTVLKLYNNNFTRYPNHVYQEDFFSSIIDSNADINKGKSNNKEIKKSQPPRSNADLYIDFSKIQVTDRRRNTPLPNYKSTRVNTGNGNIDTSRIRNMFTLVIKCYKKNILKEDLYKIFNFTSKGEYNYFFDKLTSTQKNKIIDY